ncbi:hypothetical protein Ga0100230_021440 [Opitutaceae bacterium TAV3]|nr:hypothetical protein Ga0100230_021440 [Opitutaceae bacterium TAV3]
MMIETGMNARGLVVLMLATLAVAGAGLREHAGQEWRWRGEGGSPGDHRDADGDGPGAARGGAGAFGDVGRGGGGGLVVIRIVPQLGVPDFFEGESLITRNEQGRPTAKLKGSGQRQGNILGATIVAGRPRVDDEVLVERREGGTGKPGNASGNANKTVAP